MNSSFPASLLNRGREGGGTCGYTKTCQNFSLFLSTGRVHFTLDFITCTFSLRTLAFPNLLSGPLSPAAGGQLQPTSGGSLQVQHCTREAAGHPMEEGRATSGPALPWSSPTWQRLSGGGGRGWWELPVRCQPAWHRHTPLHCHKSPSCG